MMVTAAAPGAEAQVEGITPSNRLLRVTTKDNNASCAGTHLRLMGDSTASLRLYQLHEAIDSRQGSSLPWAASTLSMKKASLSPPGPRWHHVCRPVLIHRRAGQVLDRRDR
ncbi:hypothetical protein E2C01_030729 [Portunus trituberculatus]|uniref:Uncharacterized protein n=1 Tax=Portunus trituberculatus TaxID=210409 RepID=A0A5B7EV03_PORTR|nr:hypothetical protein [Portunus trituberculatus]